MKNRPLPAFSEVPFELDHVLLSHGIIQYADRSSRIRYAMKGRKHILQILREMGESRHAQTVHRDHELPGRCRACGYRNVRDEALNCPDLLVRGRSGVIVSI